MPARTTSQLDFPFPAPRLPWVPPGRGLGDDPRARGRMDHHPRPDDEAPEVIRAVRSLRHWTQSYSKIDRPADARPACDYIEAADVVSRSWREDGVMPGYFVTVDLLRLCDGLREAYVQPDLSKPGFPDGPRSHTARQLTAYRDTLVATLAVQDEAA